MREYLEGFLAEQQDWQEVRRLLVEKERCKEIC